MEGLLLLAAVADAVSVGAREAEAHPDVVAVGQPLGHAVSVKLPVAGALTDPEDDTEAAELREARAEPLVTLDALFSGDPVPLPPLGVAVAPLLAVKGDAEAASEAEPLLLAPPLPLPLALLVSVKLPVGAAPVPQALGVFDRVEEGQSLPLTLLVTL